MSDNRRTIVLDKLLRAGFTFAEATRLHDDLELTWVGEPVDVASLREVLKSD